MSVVLVVTKSPSLPSSSRPEMIAPLLNMKLKAVRTKLSPLFLSHIDFSRVAQIPLFPHAQKPEADFQTLWPPTVPPKGKAAQCGITLSRRAGLLQHQHNVPGLEYTSKLLVYLWAYFTAQSVCANRKKKKKRLSGHKERNAVKAGRPWQLDEPSRPTVNSEKHGAKRLTSQSLGIWSHGYIEKQTDSPKKTVSNPQTEWIVWACSRLLKHLDATVNDGAHLSMLDQLQRGRVQKHEQSSNQKGNEFPWTIYTKTSPFHPQSIDGWALIMHKQKEFKNWKHLESHVF